MASALLQRGAGLQEAILAAGGGGPDEGRRCRRMESIVARRSPPATREDRRRCACLTGNAGRSPLAVASGRSHFVKRQDSVQGDRCAVAGRLTCRLIGRLAPNDQIGFVDLLLALSLGIGPDVPGRRMRGRPCRRAAASPSSVTSAVR